MTRARTLTFAALAVAWAAAIYWVSSRSNPFPFLPSRLFSFDKVLHAGAYAVLGGLVAASLARTRLWPGRAVLLAIVLATAYGASDELHQSRVPNRDADPADLLADATGAVLGAAAAALVLRPRRARASIGA
jgi:VanZ family protein